MQGGDEVVDDVAARAASGDAAAIDELIGIIDRRDLARTVIRRLIIDPADVDDVNQDVLIRVAQRISSFDGQARFTTWLHTVSRNAAIDHLRRGRATEELDETEPSDQARVSSLIARRADLESVFAGLPEHYREVVLLRDVEGHTYEAIAERLDVPINTVRSRLARGRALVARRLDGGR